MLCPCMTWLSISWWSIAFPTVSWHAWCTVQSTLWLWPSLLSVYPSLEVCAVTLPCLYAFLTLCFKTAFPSLFDISRRHCDYGLCVYWPTRIQRCAQSCCILFIDFWPALVRTKLPSIFGSFSVNCKLGLCIATSLPFLGDLCKSRRMVEMTLRPALLKVACIA